ncbi:hypothetical protein DFH07DRAFT_991822 [Mycena maculata]|uniref:Uncharacterized protein n=1 Tax=Mycena maculata TaxID=230809 RepID=A0AAD7I0R3_9AGAR|nr:hypothetical protein DFH07DRAFT_991822 [Mycena maculata]
MSGSSALLRRARAESPSDPNTGRPPRRPRVADSEAIEDPSFGNMDYRVCILRVEDHLFQIHLFHLLRDEDSVFHDMFSMPAGGATPQGFERGNPVLFGTIQHGPTTGIQMVRIFASDPGMTLDIGTTGRMSALQLRKQLQWAKLRYRQLNEEHIMASRAMGGQWMKPQNVFHNEGLHSGKSCVPFQTDGITVSWTATVPARLAYKPSLARSEGSNKGSPRNGWPVAFQMEGPSVGIQTSPQTCGSMKKWWRNSETSGLLDKKLMSPHIGFRSAMP